MITFRTDKETEKKLAKLAQKLKKTKTDVLREALQVYLEADRSMSRRKKSRAVPIQEFLGVWDGPEDSSLNTGSKFREHLTESRKTRRD